MPTPVSLAAILPLARRSPVGVAAAVAAPPPFRVSLRRLLTQSGFGYSLACSSTLRSFRVSTALFATMVSADFSHALAQETSPGKVHEHLWLRAVRLYLMRLSVTFGFRVS